jgi:hypothetical protein
MTKNTIGPWFYDECAESIGSPAGWIASIPQKRISKSDVAFGDLHYDALLIAAAPDLLAACEMALPVLLLWSPAYRAVETAIKKARGEE